NGIKMYGFFTDLSKNKIQDHSNGIFYTSVINNEVSDPVFNYFDEKTLTELFKEDPDDNQNKLSKRLEKRKKKALSNKLESIDEDYEIEVAKSLDSDHIVLFCTKVYNYAVTTCNSNGQCTTRYYCR